MTRSRCSTRDVRRLMVLCSSVAITACDGVGAPEASNPPPPGMPTDTAAYNALLAKYPVSSTFHDRKRCAKHTDLGSVQSGRQPGNDHGHEYNFMCRVAAAIGCE